MFYFVFQAEDGIRYLVRSRGLGDVYKRQTILRELKRTDWLNINGAALLPEYRGSGGTAILYLSLIHI